MAAVISGTPPSGTTLKPFAFEPTVTGDIPSLRQAPWDIDWGAMGPVPGLFFNHADGSLFGYPFVAGNYSVSGAPIVLTRTDANGSVSYTVPSFNISQGTLYVVPPNAAQLYPSNVSIFSERTLGVGVTAGNAQTSAPGGGTANIADHTDQNNAYLVALAA